MYVASILARSAHAFLVVRLSESALDIQYRRTNPATVLLMQTRSNSVLQPGTPTALVSKYTLANTV